MSFSALARSLLALRVALAPLRSRAVTRLAGVDARKFAQKLITNDIHLLHPTTSPTLHAALLAPQGRILHDVFLSLEHENSLLIDHCASTADQLRALLRRYRMRANVSIEPAPDRRVLALLSRTSIADVPLLVRDPRLDALGYRLVVDAANGAEQLEAALRGANVAYTRVDESIYDLYRTCLGVPSDPVEISPGVSLPAEATLDYLNAISYSKGCYVGQELTARTHFVGTTRKMLVPIVPVAPPATDEPLPPPLQAEPGTLFEQWANVVFAPTTFGLLVPPVGAELVGQTRGRRAAGKVMRGGVWGAGFALIRLEHLPSDDIGSVEFEWSGGDNAAAEEGYATRVRAIAPHWWRAQQEAVHALNPTTNL
jgi:folate-binding protein YgfZ